VPITTNSPTATELLAEMRARTPQMVEQLGAFVNLESPSLNLDKLQRSAEYLAGLFASITGKTAQIFITTRSSRWAPRRRDRFRSRAMSPAGRGFST